MDKTIRYFLFLVLAAFSLPAFGQLNRHDFTFSAAGDFHMPLGRYQIGTAIEVLCQVEGYWSEVGGVYHLTANWGELPSVAYRGEGNGMGERLKFHAYVDPASSAHMFLFASWVNLSPSKTSPNTVRLGVSTMGPMDVTQSGNFSSAVELRPAALTVNSYLGYVGVGTTKPTAKFHVYQSANDHAYVTLERSSNSYQAFQSFTPAGTVSGTNPKWLVGMRQSSADFEVQTFDGSHSTERLYLKTNGNVGIGTSAPDQRLTIKGGGIGFDGNSADKKLYSPADGVLEWMTHDLAGERAFAVSHQGDKRVYLASRGNSYFTGGSVSIGTTDPKGYKLAVNGSAVFTKAVVKQYGNWPDYVFESTYNLPTLQDVEVFIKQYKHLPDVPSAKEVEEKGLDLGSNQAVLLKKIEEQMLYILQLNKQIEAMKQEMKKLQNAINHK